MVLRRPVFRVVFRRWPRSWPGRPAWERLSSYALRGKCQSDWKVPYRLGGWLGSSWSPVRACSRFQLLASAGSQWSFSCFWHGATDWCGNWFKPTVNSLRPRVVKVIWPVKQFWGTCSPRQGKNWNQGPLKIDHNFHLLCFFIGPFNINIIPR